MVGYPAHGLYIGSSGKLICTQAGSPSPKSIVSFASFLAAGSVFTSTRVTEGFPDAFGPKSAPQNLNADTGTRIVVQYSGFPAGATCSFPRWSRVRTRHAYLGGDLGLSASGGQYTPGVMRRCFFRLSRIRTPMEQVEFQPMYPAFQAPVR